MSCTKSPASSMLSVLIVTSCPTTWTITGPSSRSDESPIAKSSSCFCVSMLKSALSHAGILEMRDAGRVNATLPCGLTSWSSGFGTYIVKRGILRTISFTWKIAEFRCPIITLMLSCTSTSLWGHRGTSSSEFCSLGHTNSDSPAKSWSANTTTPRTTVELFVATRSVTFFSLPSTCHLHVTSVSTGIMISCPSPCFIWPVVMCRMLSS
mmetsp:Transcript_45356/g.108178  ORF Transcript_45356/g.108178 Transcript_45356/m.108178 type:complete len:209 (-) Transcript_45356:1129-1755(-)